MFQRREQIRTQPSFLLSNSIEIPALQQQGEKTLGQIFGFLCSNAFSPNEAINRSPIGATKFFQSLLCRWRLTLRFKDDAPIRRRKNRLLVRSGDLRTDFG